MISLLLFRFFKYAALLMLAGATAGAFLPERDEVRKRMVYGVGTAGLALTWIAGFGLLRHGGFSMGAPWIAGPVAAILLFGLWLERNLLIWPSVIKGEMLSWFGLIQIGVALGFGGIFLLVVLTYSRVFPTIAVSTKD